MDLYGAIESGGHKFVCLIAKNKDTIIEEMVFSTKEPKETIFEVINFFRQYKDLQSLGIASFGPLDLNENSSSYGILTTTPKILWQGIDLRKEINMSLGIPVYIDTDVNSAALAEHLWGSGIDVSNLVYITVGTGIGAGIICNDKLIKGFSHTEFGHIRIPHDFKEDSFSGICIYHGNCLEGLASAPAINKRCGLKQGQVASPDHQVWNLVAKYLSLAVNNLIFTVAPEKIILGGGVMKNNKLITLIRKNVTNLLNSYVEYDPIKFDIENFIVSPKLGDKSGVLGALAIAMSLYSDINS